MLSAVSLAQPPSEDRSESWTQRPLVNEAESLSFVEDEASRVGAYGNPGTTRTVTLKTRSISGNTRDNTHDPTTANGGTALSEGLAALSSPVPVGFAFDLPPPDATGFGVRVGEN